MTGWENFFLAEVGASAALAGLIFVGVSINLSRILSLHALPNLVLQALILLLTVLAVSSLLLVPGQPLLLVGSEVLAAGLVTPATIILLDLNSLRKTEPQYRRVYLIKMSLNPFAVLPYVIAGITLLVSGAGASTG